LNVDEGGWDEVVTGGWEAVTPLELEVRYWIQREEPEEGREKQVSNFAFAFVAMGDSDLTIFLWQTMNIRTLFLVRR
jgi:hypothetical protein